MVNDEHKTAVFLRFVAKRCFRGKRNRPYKNPHDIANRITTTAVGKNAVLHFFNKPQFHAHDLVVPIGSHIHEACLFFKKTVDGLTIIYYSSNYSMATQGTQYSKVGITVVVTIEKGCLYVF